MAKIGLIQVDGKLPNLALMKLANWHRAKGDDVKIIDISTNKFDRIYGSKIFMGGSGYDLKAELPPDIEAQVPDYELFNTDYSIGFTSRGCIRDCGFCIVKEKEGMQRDVDYDWVKHENVLLLDNNFLASPRWREKLEYFIAHKIKVCFDQGLDIRLITPEKASLLAKVKYYDNQFSRRRLYFAFDKIEYESQMKKGFEILQSAGIPPRHLMFYILTGFDTSFEKDYYRFKVINDLGALPFIMLHKNGKKGKYAPLNRRFAKWINKMYYQFIPWDKFDPKRYSGA